MSVVLLKLAMQEQALCFRSARGPEELKGFPGPFFFSIDNIAVFDVHFTTVPCFPG